MGLIDKYYKVLSFKFDQSLMKTREEKDWQWNEIKKLRQQDFHFFLCLLSWLCYAAQASLGTKNVPTSTS